MELEPRSPELPASPEGQPTGRPAETAPDADHLEPVGPTVDEASFADDFAAGTDAPLGRAGVARALANE